MRESLGGTEIRLSLRTAYVREAKTLADRLHDALRTDLQGQQMPTLQEIKKRLTALVTNLAESQAATFEKMEHDSFYVDADDALSAKELGCGWFEQVYLVYEGSSTKLHRQGQRAILELHVPLTYNVMADEFREFQPAVAGDFKHGKIKLGRELLDAARFATTCRAVNIQRITVIYESDHHIAALLMEDVIGLNSRSEQRRRCIAFDHFAGRRSAEYGPGVEVRDCGVFENMYGI